MRAAWRGKTIFNIFPDPSQTIKEIPEKRKNQSYRNGAKAFVTQELKVKNPQVRCILILTSLRLRALLVERVQ